MITESVLVSELNDYHWGLALAAQQLPTQLTTLLTSVALAGLGDRNREFREGIRDVDYFHYLGLGHGGRDLNYLFFLNGRGLVGG